MIDCKPYLRNQMLSAKKYQRKLFLKSFTCKELRLYILPNVIIHCYSRIELIFSTKSTTIIYYQYSANIFFVFTLTRNITPHDHIKTSVYTCLRISKVKYRNNQVKQTNLIINVEQYSVKCVEVAVGKEEGRENTPLMKKIG